MFFKQKSTTLGATPVIAQNTHYQNKNGLKNMFVGVFLLTVFLIPLVFYPGQASLSYSMKIAFLSTLGTLSIVLLLLNILGTGEIEFPKTKIIAALFLLPLAALISSLVSGNIMSTVVGNVF